MQINVALENNSYEQAEIIRKKWYRTTTAQQTRDAFIFNECVDRFSGEPEELIPYIGKNEGSAIVHQRRLTIKRESNDRLKTIAAAINKPLATTYRAIIAYTIDNLPATEYESDQNFKNNSIAEISVLVLVFSFPCYCIPCCRTYSNHGSDCEYNPI